MYICGKCSLIIFFIRHLPKNTIYSQGYYFVMGNTPGPKITSAPECSLQGGEFCGEVLVPNSQMQMDSFKLLDLQTKHLLNLSVVESGKKKKKSHLYFVFPSEASSLNRSIYAYMEEERRNMFWLYTRWGLRNITKKNRKSKTKMILQKKDDTGQTRTWFNLIIIKDIQTKNPGLRWTTLEAEGPAWGRPKPLVLGGESEARPRTRGLPGAWTHTSCDHAC